MAASKEPTKTDSKVFDVAKPDTDTASKTASQPSHTMITQKPVADDGEAVKPESEKLVAPSISKLKIQPISKMEDIKPTEPEHPSTDESDDELTDENGNSLKEASQDDQDLAEKKEAERQANLDKIAAAKTYYLPINQVVRRRSKRIAVLGAVLIVVLGLAWLDIALDAQLITIPGVEAPTHFFSK